MEKINFKSLNIILRKNSVQIILIILLFIACGCFYSFNMVTPMYKSKTTILLASNNSNSETNTVTQTEINLNKSLISTYSKILNSDKVLGNVIENLNLDITINELHNNVQIGKVDDSQIIELSVTNKNAYEAQKILNELNDVFIEEIKRIYKIDNINIVDEASLATSPYNINHIKDILCFFLFGCLFSAGMVACIYLIDTTVKNEKDIEEYIGINVIGTIQKNKDKDIEPLITKKSNFVVSEALKTIRTNLSFMQINESSKSILFTSCNPGEGKSWISSNMAVTYAQSNKNVIIVDADMRKGTQHNIFNMKNTQGLSNCLSQIKNSNDYETLEKYIQETQIPKVHIITIGAIPPNPSELLLSSKMEDLIRMLKCMYDVVIIDGTPCKLVSDCIPVSKMVDMTILIAESRKTKLEDLKECVKSIKNVHGNINGIILNKKEIKNKEYSKGYYYGEKIVNNQVEIKSCSVKELIENRKDEIEYVENYKEEKNNSEELIEELSKKIENIENDLLKLPELNLDSYTKIVDEVRKIYNKELNQNKLAEEIKENIANNEIIKKINNLNEENKNLIDSKLEELNYRNEINSLMNKLNDIEEAIEEKQSEEKIISLISEMKQEQNSKLESLDQKEILNQILEKISQQNIKLDSLDNKEAINEMMSKLDSLDNKEIINEMISKLDNLDNKEVINELLYKIDMQNKKLESLDTSIILNNIVIEMQKLNNKYDKISELEKRLENYSSEKDITIIQEELKKLNENYRKILKDIAKEKNKDYNKEVLKLPIHKNNIIEMSEIKKKLNKKDLFVNYGEEIDYEDLLEYAIQVYELKLSNNQFLYSVN